MNTYTSENVWPHNKVAPTMFAIGVGLGRTCRFAGHLKHWYPVLSHTIVVSMLMSDNQRIHGLLHDAPEACVGDVPTPWKTKAAKRRENMLLRRIYVSLNLDWPRDPMAELAVDVADRTALAAEAHVLGHPCADEYWPTYDEYAGELTLAQLSICRDYLEADCSGPVYETMVEHALRGVGDVASRA